ncbi:hypothetical protein PPL_02526 [Heterostelium album PN500]|uniref:RRM domain-containing protein n=1 Tax=Heterostelium pallidum (strain ATCC 26659 / Pp 5 / PN500) TaxID=670386 RepID=D3B2B7_HETP5|nr:hypothetical protein PPL_02526 [Heterostelium album PN500]EFA84492.1 hypothetical protein PPL_02526 [Heterostelium album PN500]|eukprot:XP_020436606.1 hypothetical protein PPL_02526 [Heterostelium album PN500]
MFSASSPVLHIRNVPPEATENDLIQCISQYSFGNPAVAVRLLEKYQQALVEMDSVDTASRVIKYALETPLLLHDRDLQVGATQRHQQHRPHQRLHQIVASHLATVLPTLEFRSHSYHRPNGVRSRREYHHMRPSLQLALRLRQHPEDQDSAQQEGCRHGPDGGCPTGRHHHQVLQSDLAVRPDPLDPVLEASIDHRLAQPRDSIAQP